MLFYVVQKLSISHFPVSTPISISKFVRPLILAWLHGLLSHLQPLSNQPIFFKTEDARANPPSQVRSLVMRPLTRKRERCGDLWAKQSGIGLAVATLRSWLVESRYGDIIYQYISTKRLVLESTPIAVGWLLMRYGVIRTSCSLVILSPCLSLSYAITAVFWDDVQE